MESVTGAVAAVQRRWSTLRSGVRRRVLGHRRLLSALLAGVAVLAAMRSVAPPAPPTVAVTVAARDLPSGAELAAGDLEVRRLPPSAVPEGAVSEGADATAMGEVLAGPVRRGEVLTDARLVGPGLLTDADRTAGAMVLPVRLADADVVGLLRVGQRVDLLAADPAAAVPEGVTLVRDVRVLAIPRPAPSGAATWREQGSGALVLLAVTSHEAELVTGHAARGRLTVTLNG